MKHAFAVIVASALSAIALPALAQHTATVEQQGSLGTASITQETGMFVYPFQASIFQGPGIGNNASIEQRGQDARATISQTESNQTAQIRQYVDGGHLGITQGGGSGNLAVIDQSGLDVRASVQQLGSANVARISQNQFSGSLEVRQSGSGNAMTVAQDSLGQSVYAEQRGTNNRADLGLNTVPSGSTRLVQHGTDNFAITRGLGMQASISQDGTGHFADMSLNGDGTLGTIEQRGTSNRAYILSVGDNNSAAIFQGGQGNLGRIDQNGTGLNATIIQNTNHPGYGNVASILQR